MRRPALPARSPGSSLVLLLLAVVLTVAGCTGCGGDDRDRPAATGGPAGDGGAVAGGADRLLPVEPPVLETAEASVQEQIAEGLAEIDRRLGAIAPGATAADPAAADPEAGEPRPGSPEAVELAGLYGELAQVFMAYEISDPARAALHNARLLQPDDFRWTYLLGYLGQLGADPRAADLLARAAEMRPDYPPVHVRLGRLHLDAGDADTAARHFERALELDPTLVAALEGMGRIATARGDHAEAVRRFRRALELQPDATSLRYLLGQSLRRQGELAAAQEQLARAGDAPVMLPDPVVQRIGGLAESSQFFIIQGSEALSDGRFEMAAGSFQQAVEIQPDSYVARRGLAFSLDKLGDVAGAVAQMREAVGRASTAEEKAEALGVLGGLLMARQEDAEGVTHLARSLEIDPGQHGLRLKLADGLARLGRMEEAVAQYDRLLRTVDEGRQAVRVRRGAALMNLGRTEEALAEYRQALREAPEEAGLYLRYAEALDFLGRSEEAEAQRRRARELAGAEGDRVAVLAGEGRLRAGRGDFTGAVERYRQALELAPGRHDVRVALAGILGHLERYDEALEEYRRVLEAQPYHAFARRGEIAALILSGRHGLARVRLNEALRRWSRDKGLALTQARLLAASPDARVRDGALALEVARRVHEAAPDLAARDTLALALAETGRVDEAARLQEEVVAEARSTGAPAADRYAERLAAYRSGRPWHAAPSGLAELLALTNPGA